MRSARKCWRCRLLRRRIVARLFKPSQIDSTIRLCTVHDLAFQRDWFKMAAGGAP